VARPHLAGGRGSRRGREFGVDPAGVGRVVRVQQVQPTRAAHVLDGMAEDAHNRRADVGDDARRVDHQDEVGRALHQGAEALLAPPLIQVLGAGHALQGERHLGAEDWRDARQVGGETRVRRDRDRALERVLDEQRGDEDRAGLRRVAEGLLRRGGDAREVDGAPGEQGGTAGGGQGGQGGLDPQQLLRPIAARGHHNQRVVHPRLDVDGDRGDLVQEQAERLQRGRVDLVAGRRGDQRHAGFAQGLLAPHGALLHDQGAGHDMHHDGREDEAEDLPRDLRRGRAQRRRSEVGGPEEGGEIGERPRDGAWRGRVERAVVEADVEGAERGQGADGEGDDAEQRRLGQLPQGRARPIAIAADPAPTERRRGGGGQQPQGRGRGGDDELGQEGDAGEEAGEQEEPAHARQERARRCRPHRTRGHDAPSHCVALPVSPAAASGDGSVSRWA